MLKNIDRHGVVRHLAEHVNINDNPEHLKIVGCPEASGAGAPNGNDAL